MQLKLNTPITTVITIVNDTIREFENKIPPSHVLKLRKYLHLFHNLPCDDYKFTLISVSLNSHN